MTVAVIPPAGASSNGHTSTAGQGKLESNRATSKATPLDYDRFFSENARRRPESAIRVLFPAELEPGMISFLAGKPNPATFPFQSITLTLKPDAVLGQDQDGQPTQITVDGKDLAEALQYGPTSGLPRLCQWITNFLSRIHGREIVTNRSATPTKTAWQVTTGHGSQDLLGKTYEVLLNPGDSVLVEEPVYTGILPPLFMARTNVIPVKADSEGLTPESLRRILSSWRSDPATSSLPYPKFVYTTPTGANPSGTTASEQRKRDVLQVVREYGILLIEDDPYYFLSFQGLGEDPITRRRTASYWGLEKEDRESWGDGRVIRFESFSKILAAGFRTGFMVGPACIIEAVNRITASTNLQPSTPAQAMALALLEQWGQDNFLRHVDRVSAFYQKRRDLFESKARSILGASEGKRAVAEWTTPVAGMFLWLKLKLPPSNISHESSSNGNGNENGHSNGNKIVASAPKDEGDSFALISEKARAAGLVAVPGVAFMPDGRTSCYVRTSFSVVPEDDFEEGFRRLRRVVEDSWKERGLELPA